MTANVTTRLLLATALLAAAAAACESKAPVQGEPDAAPEAPAPPAFADPEPPPAPAAAVERFTADPADAPVELVEGGKVIDQLGWSDARGRNLLFFVRHDRQDGEYSGTSTLVAGHYLQTGASDDAGLADAQLEEVRVYREIVERCEFDIILEPFLGDWSVSDLDADGVGEATFAWTADCTSDVSPNRHEVLLIEAGEEYALRGVTQVDPGDGPMGGEFDVDPAFDAAPEPFEAHAAEVWAKTSTGRR